MGGYWSNIATAFLVGKRQKFWFKGGGGCTRHSIGG